MLYGLLRRSAAAFAGRPALVEGGQVLTYAELLAAVDAARGRLRAAGLGPGDTTAIQMPNSAECVVSLFAAAGEGGAVLPLDPALTPQEVERYASLAGAALVVRSGGQIIRLPASAARDAARYAVLLLSSGTAGAPKTVPKTASQAEAALRIYRATVPYAESDRVLGVLPFCHSFGLYNVLLATLASGAALHLEPFAPRQAAATIEREGITVLPATPLMFRLLAETPFRTRPDVSSLRLAISAGSALPFAVAARFREAFGIAIAQSYGTTETGPLALARLDESAAEPVWLATPYVGVTLAVLDAEGQPLAPGQEGEIAVSSPACTAGYLHSPEASAAIRREQWLLTGDLGRLDAAGNLIILGRRKPMLDVGGKKVAPAEVEACLRTHPAVAEAVVTGGGSHLHLALGGDVRN